MTRLLLASQSPTRRRMLEAAGVPFEAVAAPLDDATGAHPVADGIQVLAHPHAGLLDLPPQLLWALAHWTSSLSVSTVCCGTGLTDCMRERPCTTRTAATTA